MKVILLFNLSSQHLSESRTFWKLEIPTVRSLNLLLSHIFNKYLIKWAIGFIGFACKQFCYWNIGHNGLRLSALSKLLILILVKSSWTRIKGVEIYGNYCKVNITFLINGLLACFLSFFLFNIKDAITFNLMGLNIQTLFLDK